MFCREKPAKPPWLQVIKPPALPIEPLIGIGRANGLIWRHALNAIDVFTRQKTTLLVIGKPSLLALAVLERLKGCRSVYDAMDDFPAFYSGLSQWAMRKREAQLVRRVDGMMVSSTVLKQRWCDLRPDVQLVHNGLDASLLPAPQISVAARDKKVFGYVGTIASWFDWDWVIALAKARPQATLRMVGPLYSPAPSSLPNNIEILPPCDHTSALSAIQNFDVGIIPFKKNSLTASVDPIKYYEYRAIGLPVLSTGFGEMALRTGDAGVFICDELADLNELANQALAYKPDNKEIQKFVAANTWDARFSGTEFLA